MPIIATMDPRHFLFLVASSRRPGVVGNTEWLARRAAASLEPEAAQTWIHLHGLNLAPFEDWRHDVGHYPMPEGDARMLLDATLAATDLVFVSPVYWYSVPAALKLYLDHWSAWLRVPELDFKPRMAGKRLWVVVTSGNEAKAQPMLQSYAHCAQFLSMAHGAALWGPGGPPGAVAQDAAALVRAEGFFAAP